jgi:hypothetical protein
MSAQQITWLFFRKPDEFKEEELENLRLIRQASPRIETASHLVEQSLQMVHAERAVYYDESTRETSLQERVVLQK